MQTTMLNQCLFGDHSATRRRTDPRYPTTV